MCATAARFIVGCLLLFRFSSVVLADEDPQPLAESFPSGAVAFAESQDLGPLVERIRNSELLEQVMLSPQFLAARQRPEFQSAQNGRILIEAVLGSDLWTSSEKIFGGRWAVALYPGDVPEQPHLAAIIETTDQEFLAEVHERLIAVLAFVGERVEYFETDDGYSGFTLDQRLSVVIDQQNIFAATTRDLLDTLQDKNRDEPLAASESLVADERFVAMTEHLGGDHHMRLFVDAQALYQPGRNGIPEKLDNPLGSLLLSGLLALAADSPYLGVSLDVVDDGFDVVVGVAGNGQDLAEPHQVFFSSPDEAGVEPVPQVAGLIGGVTLYRDIDGWYRQRESYLQPEALPAFDQFETNIGNLLPGRDIGEDVLPLLGDRITLLAALQSYEHLDGEPGIKLPAFAAIIELDDPRQGADTLRLFFQTLTAVLNLQAGQQGREPWILDSETYADTQISFARYLSTPAGDSLPIVFNFQPTSAQIGDRFLICSSVDLCRDLIEASQQPTAEARTTNRNLGLEIHAEAAADVLERNRGLFEARAIQAGGDPAQAGDDFDALLEMIRNLQSLHLSSSAGEETFELQLQGRWK